METCRYDHVCTSGCGNDYDCPCQADHCCALTQDCEGGDNCDDHYEAKKDNREFSPEQERIIAHDMRICELAKCEGPDHGDHLAAQDELIDLEKHGK